MERKRDAACIMVTRRESTRHQLEAANSFIINQIADVYFDYLESTAKDVRAKSALSESSSRV